MSKASTKDKPAPKGKKPKDETKGTGPKLVKESLAGVGHNQPNNGEKNPEAIKLMQELMDIQEQKKSLGKAEREIRNTLKTGFGILASSVSREISLRKMDSDVRVQVETNHEDFKKMLGYQPSLDFGTGAATSASVKAQPKEDELDARNPEPNRAATTAPTGKTGFTVSDEEEGGEGDNVITREG